MTDENYFYPHEDDIVTDESGKVYKSTTKQYTRGEMEARAAALDKGARFSRRTTSVAATMLRQCLARIDQLEAEPGEAEVAEACIVYNKTRYELGQISTEQRDFTALQAAITAFLKMRRGA